MVKATYEVINMAPRVDKIILKNVYLLNQTNEVGMSLTGYAPTAFNNHKNKSLLYFANAFKPIYDLCCYID